MNDVSLLSWLSLLPLCDGLPVFRDERTSDTSSEGTGQLWTLRALGRSERPDNLLNKDVSIVQEIGSADGECASGRTNRSSLLGIAKGGWTSQI